MLNSTERFSSRVDNYAKYRLGYPPAILELLRDECHLAPGSAVADIGSGTGILTAMLLANRYSVFAVEPNREMREAAEHLLNSDPGFKSVIGTAEATTLPPQSIDLITAAQAFHWFNCAKTRPEFLRILKPGGWVALIWNARNISSSSFHQAYENLLKTFGTDYSAVGHKQGKVENIGPLFGARGFRQAVFPNQQSFDLEGLQGRLLSSSYVPEPGQPDYEPMLTALALVFAEHSVAGKVTFDYDTTVYYGQLRL